jgi:hypothetical protein
MERALKSVADMYAVNRGDRNICGQNLVIDGVPSTVVGVMPKGIWIPRK